MRCLHCGCTESEILETKQRTISNEIYRRRICLKCGTRFTTKENIRIDLPTKPINNPSHVS